MGITQQIGASSLIKPGVIDNTAARPASPYEGQVIFQKDTDQLLVWNGTAWVIPNSPAQNPQGLEYITSGTLSSVSTIAINNCFTSTYNNYRIVVNITAGGGGPAQIQMRMRIGGSDTSGSSYYYFFRANNYAGTGGDQPGNGVSNWFNLRTNGSTFGGVIDIQNPNLAVATHFFSTGSDTDQGFTCGGYHNSTTQFDGFSLSNSGAASMTGTVTVYGYRK